MAEKSSADAANLLAQFDDRLAARIGNVEQTLHHQVTDVNQQLSSIHTRLENLEQALQTGKRPGGSGDPSPNQEATAIRRCGNDEPERQAGIALSDSSARRLKPPTFDGLGSWRAFIVQFETVALRNG